MKLKHYILLITYALIIYFIFINFGQILKILSIVYGILIPFILGFGIAYVVNMPFNFCQEKIFVKLDTLFNGKFKPIKKILSFICSYAFVLGIVVFLISIIIPQLILSVRQLVNNFSNYANSMEEISVGFLRFTGITEELLDSCIKHLMNFFVDVDEILPQIFDLTKSFTIGVYNWIIGLVVSFYVLGSKDKLKIQMKKILYAMTPGKYIGKIFKVYYLSSNIFGKYIIGTVLDSLIVGVVCFIGMMLFNMPYALLISVVIGITNIIPVFGPFIGGIPSFLILFIINPIQSIWFALFILVLQQLDGNILKPKILSNSIGLPGLWVMFSVIIGGGLFGVVGMVLGVPVFAIIYIIVGDFINKRLKSKKMLTTDDNI